MLCLCVVFLVIGVVVRNLQGGNASVKQIELIGMLLFFF